MDTSPVAAANQRDRTNNLLICLVIAIATLTIYLQTSRFGFVHFDDTGDALNANIRRGLTFENLRWALTSGSGANWLPLTRFSHIVDFSLYGASAGPRHLENLVLHLLASLMVFFFLLRATGARWPSAFSGLLFAVHPLHVESVAWIAERKDTLSALFWFLTLWAWVRYTSVGYTGQPSRKRYLAALGLFCLALMSKPMVVTLPVVLLLLDFWPLGRGLSRKTVLEKLPFFALSAAGAIVTVVAQRIGGAIKGFSAFGPGLRIENALVSWVVYPVKMLWPSDLGVWYPYPLSIDSWLWMGCAALLIAISLATFRLRVTLPYLLTGWLWYLITTLPVIGLIQVGSQAHADRYMYIPMVGLGIAVAWGAADLIRHWPATRIPIGSAGAVSLAALAAFAFIQTGYWRDSESLFRHTIAVTQGNYLAWQNLGSALAEAGRKTEAMECFRTVIRIKPDTEGPHTSLCGILPDKAEALRECDTALRIEPDNWEAHNNRGAALKTLGRLPEAAGEYRIAIRQLPSAAEAHANLGMILLEGNQFQQALAEEDKAVQLDSGLVQAHYTRGRALFETGNAEAAVEEFEATLRMQPNSAEAHAMLGAALSRVPWGHFDCYKEFSEALRLDPNLAIAHAYLALALSQAGRDAEAKQQIEIALQREPGPRWAGALAQIEAKSDPAKSGPVH